MFDVDFEKDPARTMRGFIQRLIATGLVLGFAASLSACAWIGDVVGVGKSPPDEFVVVDKRPLVVPPDFKLRPPEPGKASPQNIQPAEEVVSALFPGRTEVPGQATRGELALLDNVSESSTNVRSSVDGETEVVNKGLLVADILALPPRRMESDGATIARVGSDGEIRTAEAEGEEESSGFFAWLFGG